jgi:hypothetical protein
MATPDCSPEAVELLRREIDMLRKRIRELETKCVLLQAKVVNVWGDP